MKNKIFQPDRPGSKNISWCPGCGDFGIRAVLMEVMEDMGFTPSNSAIISGIGQAGKMPHYINANGFHTLHGRAIPIAVGVKASNPELNVIVVGGDGDMYSEGMEHFVHGIRRNANVTVFIHNNQVYALTKGQASPTSMIGMKTAMQPSGVFEEPINPIALAISLDASFVARTFIGHKKETKEIMAQALEHKGFSMVDIFQPCVTFNKINTYEWYKNKTSFLIDHDPCSKTLAFERALETDPYNLGVFYKKDKPIFEEMLEGYQNTKVPLFKRNVDTEKVKAFIVDTY